MPSRNLTPKKLIELLIQEFKLGDQAGVAEFLGISRPRVSQIKSSPKITAGNLKLILSRAHKDGKRLAAKENRSELNKKILDSYKELHNLRTQAELATSLGTSRENVAQWESGNTQITQSTVRKILKEAVPIKITPLLEMTRIDPGKPGGKWYFFNEKTNNKRTALIKKINGRRGLYFYFNATGHLTYAGKADKTTLEKEVENRLAQETKKNRIPYGEGMKKNPILKQGEIVEYISVYEVSPREAIPLVEALIIRVTGNYQYNKRLEGLSK